MKRILPAVMLLCLSVSVVRAQSPKERETLSPEEIRAANYQKLFTMTSGIFRLLPKTCKTEACATLAAEGAKLVAEGQDKHTRGILVAEERAVWHAKLTSALHRSIIELQGEMIKKYGKPVPTAALTRPTCVKPAYLATDQCGLCYDTFENLAEICALYAFVSPEAARHSGLICLAWAALNFGGCLNQYCTSEGAFNLN